MWLSFIIMGILGVVGFIFHLIDVISERREGEVKATIKEVSSKRPVFRWYQIYTFSLHGQHFQIQATSVESAWKQTRRMGVGNLFLISESAPQCEVKYKSL